MGLAVPFPRFLFAGLWLGFSIVPLWGVVNSTYWMVQGKCRETCIFRFAEHGPQTKQCLLVGAKDEVKKVWWIPFTKSLRDQQSGDSYFWPRSPFVGSVRCTRVAGKHVVWAYQQLVSRYCRSTKHGAIGDLRKIAEIHKGALALYLQCSDDPLSWQP